MSTPTLSNGFDVPAVMEAFQGRLGWSQPTVAGVPTLSTQNLMATSTRFYEDFHEGVRLKLLLQSQEDDNITPTNFNALLQKWDQAAIMRCLNAVFCKPRLIEHCMNYERVSNVRQIVIPNQGNFCGYRIKVSQGDYAVVINKIGLMFNAVATFNIYLFNDLKAAPLQTMSVTTVANDQTIINLEWLIRYIGTSHKGGLFYIGYFQNDLPSNVNALDEQLNMWAASKIFGAYPFQSAQIPGQLDFIRINPQVVFRSYGVSAELTSYRDYTEKIIENAHLFDEARGLTMAIKVLEQIRWSYRTNPEYRKALEAQAGDWAKIFNQEVNVAESRPETQPFVAGLKQQVKRELQSCYLSFFPKQEAMSVVVGPEYDKEAFAYDTFDIGNLPPRERFY